MYKCKFCDIELNSLDSLRIHSSKKHSMTSQQVYNEYILKGSTPLCKCGCNQEVPFITLQKGYREWIKGHVARVTNNWGHNKIAIDNSSNTRRNQFKNGERQVWNTGLTKESDIRVANYSKSGSISIQNNKHELQRRSSIMKKGWDEGVYFSKFGIESPNWKGGASSIGALTRSDKRMYLEWKFPILQKDGFQCTNCKCTEYLEVHHCSETMSEIMRKFIDKEKEYNFEEKKEIVYKIVSYHIDNNIEGQTLCKECHSNLHPNYNINFTKKS